MLVPGAVTIAVVVYYLHAILWRISYCNELAPQFTCVKMTVHHLELHYLGALKAT